VGPARARYFGTGTAFPFGRRVACVSGERLGGDRAGFRGQPTMTWSSLKSSLACAALALAGAISSAHAAPLRVGIVTDGRNDREILSPASIEQQIEQVTGKDPQVVLPADKRFAGDWSVAGADAALDRALSDKDVDVIVTLGILASQQAAHREKLTKP